jgi:hypothetical protein
MTDDVAAKCCSLTRAAAHVYDGIALSSLINYDGVRAFVLREPITEQAFKKKKFTEQGHRGLGSALAGSITTIPEILFCRIKS